MTIFEVLGRQHGELDTMFRQVHDRLASGRIDAARETFQSLSTKLLGMMHAEHTVVYPKFVYLADLGDEVSRAIREHSKIEDAVNHIRLAPLDAEGFRGAVTRLQVLISDHQETEEWILFPVATLRMSGDVQRQLATEYQAYEPLAEAVAAPSITWDIAA
jgi:hypothetical protein